MPNNHRYFCVSGPDRAPSAREITREETLQLLESTGHSPAYVEDRIGRIEQNPGQPIIIGHDMVYTG